MFTIVLIGHFLVLLHEDGAVVIGENELVLLTCCLFVVLVGRWRERGVDVLVSFAAVVGDFIGLLTWARAPLMLGLLVTIESPIVIKFADHGFEILLTLHDR